MRPEDETGLRRLLLERQSEAYGVGLLVVAVGGTQVLAVNARFCELWGLPDDAVDAPDVVPLLAATLPQFVEPESAHARIVELRASLEPSRDELRLRDGRVVERIGTPLLDDDGLHVARAWFFRDVTAERSAQRSLHEGKEQLDAITRGVADGILIHDLEGRLVYANDAAARAFGLERGEQLLDTLWSDLTTEYEVTGADGRPLSTDDLPGARARRGEDVATIQRIRRRDGTGGERWSVVHGSPVRDETGAIRYAITIFHDVTEHRRAEERLEFLTRASDLLSTSLDVEATLARIAALAVEGLADWCMVYRVEPDGSIRRLAIEHADPALTTMLRGELLSGHPLDPESGSRVAGVIRSGLPDLLPDASAELLAQDGRDPAALAQVLDRAGVASWMCVPVSLRERSLGAIAFLRSRTGDRYGGDDLSLAQELAARAAVAMENASLYAEARDSLALLDAVVETAPVGLAFFDRDLRYVRVNDAMARINGVPAAEHVGRTVDEILPYVPPSTVETMRDVLATGKPVVGRELDGYTRAAHGRLRYWVVNAYRIGGDAALGVGFVVEEVTERKLAERRAAVENAVNAVLAEADEAEPVPRVLAAIGSSLGWPAAELWRPGVDGEALYRAESWRAHDFDSLAFDTARVGMTLARGESLAGRAWATGEAEWIADLAATLDRFATAREALAGGLRSAVAVPLLGGAGASGVMVLFDRVPRERDAELERLLTALGRRLAEHLDRRRAEAERAALLTAEREARADAEAARGRLEFLSEASAALATSLDYRATLTRVTELAVPRLADWCTLVLADELGAGRFSMRHPDPTKVALAEEMNRRWPLRLDGRVGVGRVIATGEPLLLTDVDEEMVREFAQDDEHYECLRSLGARSYMAVPLRRRDRILGVLTFAAAESGRRFLRDDLALAEEVARRGAVAIENALLFRAAEEQAQAARVLASIGDGVLLVDAGGDVRLWNAAAAAITGIGPDAAIGRPVSSVLRGWEAAAARIPVAEAPGPRAGRAEAVPLEVGDRELWLAVAGVSLPDGTVYAFRDLTQERALEELRSDFVATVSHELRTPLAAVYGAAMTLRRPGVDLGPAERERLLDMIAAESEQLARIVNDILWASRLDTETMHVDVAGFDARELVERVLEAARAHAPKGIELAVAAPPPLPPVRADADKVRQVLVNLVDNAIKYSPDGGAVTVRLEERGGQVRFAVSDRGIGIPAADQRRVFDKFFRVDPAMARGIGGTGLGLYICRELVRRMEGRLWVDSTEGEGSTFTFELPAETSRGG